MKKLIYIGLFLFMGTSVFAGGGDRQAYIDRWKDVAIDQMEKHGIPASITLAQGILESGNGKSMLTKEANNHFGIKCHGWKGPGVYKDDDKKNECFRKYKNAKESFEDHSQFLLKKRYAGLFELKPTDYKGWARGLKKAGYATDPAYAKRLISLIETNDLTRFDDPRLAKRRKFEATAKREKPRKEVSESTDVEIHVVSARKIEMHPNRIKFVKAKKGDDIQSIAKELDLAPWQIKKYNDLGSRRTFKEGEIVFIQPKRKSGKKVFHKALKGETLHDVSRNHGVSLKKLIQYNDDMPPDKPLSAGQRIRLKKPKT